MIKKLSMAVCFAMVFAAGSAYAKKEKVDVCHVPPDNPTNAHIISIPLKASLAHIWHGDLSPGAQESGIYCDDGIDNDCDGDTDAADASCAPPPDACLEAGGTRVDGLEGCYFLGSNNQSCTTVCTGAGLVYSLLTQTETGADGTNDACRSALIALDAPKPRFCSDELAPEEVGDIESLVDTAHCTAEARELSEPAFCEEFPDAKRITWFRNLTTSDGDADDSLDGEQRVCACQQPDM